MPVGGLIKDPAPGGTTTTGATIYTDQHNLLVDIVSGDGGAVIPKAALALTATVTKSLEVPNIPSVDANVTSYICPGSNADFLDETKTGILISENCTLTALKCTCTANGITANTIITVRKDGADTTSTVTYASGETGAKNDIAHTVAFTAGQVLTISIAGGATGSSMSNLKISLSMRYSVTLS